MKRCVKRTTILASTLAWGVLAAGCARTAVVESDPRAPTAEETARLEAAVRGDLEALRRAQDDHHAATGRYTYEVDALDFTASAGVRVDILEAAADGFSALGSAESGRVECALFVGSAEPPRSYVGTAGVVACRP